MKSSIDSKKNDSKNVLFTDESTVRVGGCLNRQDADVWRIRDELDQACLTPLKEDLADWLNKIFKTTAITTENFMDKLDNGVIICRLAKIISLWCTQQLETNNVHSTSICKLTSSENYQPRTPVPRPRMNPVAYGLLRTASSQSTNCLTSAQSTNSLNHYIHNNYQSCGNQFLDNLIQMINAKIWDDVKGRTFYARDNVCNFIRWSREFGVNQSVLFESDDLVLHANTRQVVLCLLDVARIAHVKYDFTEAPGLVKFEQEIDNELFAAKDKQAFLSQQHDQFVDNPSSTTNQLNDTICYTLKESSRAKNSVRSKSIGDATDELVMRYCKHKQEEAARKMSEQLELDKHQSDFPLNNNDNKFNGNGQVEILTKTDDQEVSSSQHIIEEPLQINDDETTPINNLSDQLVPTPPLADLTTSVTSQQTSSITTNSELSSSRSSLTSNQQEVNFDDQSSSGYGRQITSDLDGKVMRIAKSYYGKGATKDVKRLSEGKYNIADRIVFVRLLKGHRVMVRIGGGWDTLENFLFRHKSDPSQVIDVDNLLPIETKMSFEKSPQVTPTNGIISPKLPNYKRSNSASSTNLSMSNLSASNHSISSNTPSNRAFGTNGCSNNRISNLPYYKPASTHNSNSLQSTPVHNKRSNQIPYLFIHKDIKHNYTSALYNKNGHRIIQPTSQTRPDSTTASPLKRPQLKTTPYSNNKHDQNPQQRSLASSRAPASSTSNLYPATLTTRLTQSAIKSMEITKLLDSANKLNNGSRMKPTNMQEAFRKYGLSSESTRVSSNKMIPSQHRQNIAKPNSQLPQRIAQNFNELTNGAQSKPMAKAQNNIA